MGKILQGSDPGTAINLVVAELFRKNTNPIALELSYLSFKLYSSPALTMFKGWHHEVESIVFFNYNSHLTSSLNG